MKKLGYQTAFIGKWHLDEEPATFDYYCVLTGQGKYFNPEFLIRGDQPWPKNKMQTEGHSTDVITYITLKWLDKKRDKSKPFFLMCHFKAPHDMFENAKRYDDYLEDVEIPEPASLYYNGYNGSVATRGPNDDYISFIGTSVLKRNRWRNMGKDLKIDQSLVEDEYTHVSYQTYLKRYLRCVKGIDDNLARLFDYLMKKEKLWDNTIIIYTSDQGMMLGEHDYIDKRWMYDKSMRIPLIIRYPQKVKKAFRSDAIINNTYFAPTIIELADGKMPDYMQGISFKSILETGREPEGFPQETYYRYWMHMEDHMLPAHFGIRTKDYKLIFYYGSYYREFSLTKAANYFIGFDTPPAWEFYNLKNDPNEMNNRYGDEAYAEIISDLKNRLATLRKNLNKGDEKYPKLKKIIEENWNK